MTIKEIEDRDAFAARWLMALKTSQADGDHKRVRIITDALAKAHELESYPPTLPNSQKLAQRANSDPSCRAVPWQTASSRIICSPGVARRPDSTLGPNV